VLGMLDHMASSLFFFETYGFLLLEKKNGFFHVRVHVVPDNYARHI
jgi:hypothetical protein